MDFDPKIKEIGDQIANLTMVDARELSDYLKEEYGIEATANVPPRFQPPEQDSGPKEEERTEFNVVLDGFEAKSKISVIKVVRQEAALGLKEAKNAVESAPYVIKEGVPKDEAERVLAALKEAGGDAKIV